MDSLDSIASSEPMFSDCFRLSAGIANDQFYHSHCVRFHWECRVLCDRLDAPLTDLLADRTVGCARRFGLRRQYCPWNDFLVIRFVKQGNGASSSPFRWVVLFHVWCMAVLLNSYNGAGHREEYEKTKPSIKPSLDVVFTGPRSGSLPPFSKRFISRNDVFLLSPNTHRNQDSSCIIHFDNSPDFFL